MVGSGSLALAANRHTILYSLSQDCLTPQRNIHTEVSTHCAGMSIFLFISTQLCIYTTNNHTQMPQHHRHRTQNGRRDRYRFFQHRCRGWDPFPRYSRGLGRQHGHCPSQVLADGVPPSILHLPCCLLLGSVDACEAFPQPQLASSPGPCLFDRLCGGNHYSHVFWASGMYGSLVCVCVCVFCPLPLTYANSH